MKRFVDLIAECLPKIKEVMPWDVAQLCEEDSNLLILDIREPYE